MPKQLDTKRAIDMARASKGWSLEYLALEMDTTRTKIDRLRNGATRLTFIDAQKICELCGVDLLDFVAWAEGKA